MTQELIERLELSASESEMGRNLAGTPQTCREAKARLQSQSARIAELDALARALVAKLDECDPHIANLSAINYARSGTQYSGPSYGEALEALRVSLTKDSTSG